VSTDARVEVEADLFLRVKDALAARIKSPCPVEIQVAVYTAVHNWQMNEAINRQQNDRYAKKQERQEEPPTEKQIKYAEDLGITVTPGMTKKQLSELIKAAV
jgi:hypothetical protein